jgi:hypothetical protein
MRASRRVLWMAIVVVLAGFGGVAGAEHEQVFKGEISDSQCALNVHSLSRSHDEMLKKKSIGTTAADCTRYCVKYMGGVYVISVKDKVYKIDNQELGDRFAGQKVKLTGVLDVKSNMIAVQSIEPLQ